MNNDRAFLRHELLNMITLVNFSISDTKLAEKKRDEILEQLKMIGLLVAKQEYLLGNEKQLSKHDIRVIEVLELVELIMEKRFKKKGVRVSIAPTELVSKGDSKVLKEGLVQILLHIMELSRGIGISVDEKARKISIKYGSVKKLSDSKAHPLEYLRDKRSNSDIFFRMAMHLMESNGIKTSYKKGLVEVVLPG